LPAQGRYRGFGVEARRGAELCMEDPAGARPFRLEPVFRDEADGAAPAAAATEFAERHGVVAIIGPLLSGTTEQLLPAAARRSLAVISPTAASGRIGERSPVFFRTCMTMESFAAALAGFAVSRLGRPAFAILTPAESYGRSFAAAFRRALEERGGSAPLVREYSPGLRDLAPWAAALGKELRPAGSGSARGWAVDALFLAGSAQEAGMILPRLAYQGLDPRTIAVVGGSALNVPEFPRLAGGYAEGALIADGFFAGSELPAAQAFTRRYRARHGVDPSAAAAQGCAAVEVLAAALGGGAAAPREVLAALGALAEIPTVVGALRVFPGGRVVRQPFFSTVRGNALVEIRYP
jgi:branched-chain amino acid transport system substrate-binding protein